MPAGKMRMSVASLMVVGLVLVTGGVWWSSRAQAKDECHQINTTQSAVANFANFTTAGEIKAGFLKGMTHFTGDPASLTPIRSTPAPPLKPTFSYTGDLLITTPSGTLTTRSVGVFENGPFGRGTQLDHVIAGSGLYSGAEGFLYFNFEADDSGAAFTSSVTGEICVH